MRDYQKEHWIDTRLTEEEMNFLNGAIATSSEGPRGDWKDNTDGTFQSDLIIDKDGWFFETVLKRSTERMFYGDWDNYRKYYIEKEESLPKFEMKEIWVNYMKQHEFNPLHFHNGGKGYSFVIFMKIPTHWKEQHALSISAKSTSSVASDFAFVRSEKNSETCLITLFSLSSEDEGRMLFFPAWLHHQVYPFYDCEEERVTISGNIDIVNPNISKKQEVSIDQYEEQENMLKMLEENVRVTKEELKHMKKPNVRREQD